MCKSARRTHGTAARSAPVADLLASETRRPRTSGRVDPAYGDPSLCLFPGHRSRESSGTWQLPQTSLGSEILGLGSEDLGLGSDVSSLGSENLKLCSEILCLVFEDFKIGSMVSSLSSKGLRLGSEVLRSGLRGFGSGP